jgi:hypothetical protein
MSRVALIFNFEETTALLDALDDDKSPPNTLTLTTGERSSTMAILKVLSHARSSSEDTDRPVSDTLSMSPTEIEPRTKEEEFTLIDNREGEPSENTSSPSQFSR